jgi:hypothetical protein
MTKFLVAALAAALMLQGWGMLSSRLLPWPDVYGQTPLAMSFPPPAGSTFAPPAPSNNALVAANSDHWPIYAFGRRDSALTSDAAAAYLGLNVALGLIAAIASVIVLRERRAIGQRIGLLLLAVVFIILLTDVTHAIWMRWPLGYSVILLTDHLVATVLAGGMALAVLALWRTPATLPTSTVSDPGH